MFGVGERRLKCEPIGPFSLPSCLASSYWPRPFGCTSPLPKAGGVRLLMAAALGSATTLRRLRWQRPWKVGFRKFEFAAISYMTCVCSMKQDVRTPSFI